MTYVFHKDVSLKTNIFISVIHLMSFPNYSITLIFCYLHNLLQRFSFGSIVKDRFVHREGKCTFCKIFNFWSLLVWQCTSRSTNPQSRFVIISYFCFSYTFFAIHIFPKIFSKMHLLHFAVYLILTGIRVCDSSELTIH